MSEVPLYFRGGRLVLVSISGTIEGVQRGESQEPVRPLPSSSLLLSSLELSDTKVYVP